MTNYSSVEQFKAITQNFSKAFDIKLSKVRHKMAIQEGFKNENAFVASFLKNDIIEINTLKNSVQKRPGLFISGEANDLLTEALSYFLCNFKSNKSSKIDFKINKDSSIEISDDSKDLLESYFLDNEAFQNFKLDHFKDNSSYYENCIPSYFITNIALNYSPILNYLSEYFHFSYFTKSTCYHFEFCDGILLKNEVIKKKQEKEGMFLKFKVNFDFLVENSFNFDQFYLDIQKVLQLNPKLELTITDLKNKNKFIQKESLKHLLYSKFDDIKTLNDIQEYYFKHPKTNESIYYAFVKTDTNDSFECVSFVNEKQTRQHGTHVDELENILKNHTNSVDLSGFKAVISINLRNFDLSRSCHKLVSKNMNQIFQSIISCDQGS